MGHTAVEKILARGAGRSEVFPGEFIDVKADLAFSHSPMLMEFKHLSQIGTMKQVFDPEKVVYAIGHHLFLPADNHRATEESKARAKCRECGVKYLYDQGSGNGHYLVLENGHLAPGEIELGSDSHTCGLGVLGAYATGISQEITEVLLSGKIWIRVPQTIKITFTGQTKQGVSARDVAQYMLGQLGPDAALWQAVEFTGDYIESLSVQQRAIFCFVVVEMGGQCGFIAPDEKTFAFLKDRVHRDFTPEYSDSDAVFSKEYTFDVSTLEPQVCYPSSPTNCAPLAEYEGQPVDQAWVGGCTGGGIEDFRMAAEILRGRKVNDNVRYLIVPGTRAQWEQCNREGLLDLFMEAGAFILPPYCGPCQMHCVGNLGDGQTMVGTHPRNWPGRCGSAQVFLASPYTATAAAVEGKLVDPRKFLRRS